MNPETGAFTKWPLRVGQRETPFNLPPSAPGSRRLLLPLLPTVFEPGPSGDQTYIKSLINALPAAAAGETRAPQRGDEAWVVGPGSGLDTWLTAIRTRSTVYVSGINPFEILNTQILADLADFKIKTAVFDNIADAKGRSPFPGKRFDWVIWNMPLLGSTIAHFSRPRYADMHDGDPDGQIIQKFIAHLPGVLKPHGYARIWNSGTDYVNQILGFAEQAGLRSRIEASADHNAVYTFQHNTNPSVGQHSRRSPEELAA